jgi:hypothetical protein
VSPSAKAAGAPRAAVSEGATALRPAEPGSAAAKRVSPHSPLPEGDASERDEIEAANAVGSSAEPQALADAWLFNDSGAPPTEVDAGSEVVPERQRSRR